jgi:hypothetical protein
MLNTKVGQLGAWNFKPSVAGIVKKRVGSIHGVLPLSWFVDLSGCGHWPRFIQYKVKTASEQAANNADQPQDEE